MEKTKILFAALFSQKSALFKNVVSSFSLLIFWGLSGCAGMPVMDNVPHGDPKGYVKFYYLRSEENNPTAISVYSTDNMDTSPYARDLYGNPTGWVGEGMFVRKYFTSDNERGLLIVKKPGNYKFMVKVYGVSEPKVFKILVQENMVVPIKFGFRNLERHTRHSGSGSTTSVSFTMDTIVEKPIPFKKDEPKK